MDYFIMNYILNFIELLSHLKHQKGLWNGRRIGSDTC